MQRTFYVWLHVMGVCAFYSVFNPQRQSLFITTMEDLTNTNRVTKQIHPGLQGVQQGGL